jgi:hypothetical protein
MADEFAVVEWSGSEIESALVGLYSVTRNGIVSDANFATIEEAETFMDEWEAGAEAEDEEAALRKLRNDGPWVEVDTP